MLRRLRPLRSVSPLRRGRRAGRPDRSRRSFRSGPAARPTWYRAPCSSRLRSNWASRSWSRTASGRAGTLGVGAVARANPDGYTILVNSSAHAIAPWIVPNVPYDTAKDLGGALMIGQHANVMIVLLSRGWKTVQDFVAAAKAKPGSINYGSAGVGTA